MNYLDWGRVLVVGHKYVPMYKNAKELKGYYLLQLAGEV